MKKLSFLWFCFFIISKLNAQQMVNLVLVGNNGVTEDIKEAHSFILVKKYPNSFQRLDYKLAAPLQKVRNYTDSTLTVLQGGYCEYALSGALSIRGHYENNLRENEWYYYNDTGKVILEEKYEQGVLIKITNPDSVKEELPEETGFKDGEREATFKKGIKDWIKYLTTNLNSEVSVKSVNGGNVIVNFRVDKEGKVVDVFLSRSVEFILDEEGIRIIENSPLWHPAIQEGKNVNAYRRQPILFRK